MDGRVDFKMGYMYAEGRQDRYNIEEPKYLSAHAFEYTLCNPASKVPLGLCAINHMFP